MKITHHNNKKRSFFLKLNAISANDNGLDEEPEKIEHKADSSSRMERTSNVAAGKH